MVCLHVDAFLHYPGLGIFGPPRVRVKLKSSSFQRPETYIYITGEVREADLLGHIEALIF